MRIPTLPLLLLACGAGLLACTQARAGCSIVQTAGNEIVIRAGAGGCDTAALQAGLQIAISGAAAASAAAEAASANSLAGIRRNGGQSALWRLATINAQAPITTLNMPGR